MKKVKALLSAVDFRTLFNRTVCFLISATLITSYSHATTITGSNTITTASGIKNILDHLSLSNTQLTKLDEILIHLLNRNYSLGTMLFYEFAQASQLDLDYLNCALESSEMQRLRGMGLEQTIKSNEINFVMTKLSCFYKRTISILRNATRSIEFSQLSQQEKENFLNVLRTIKSERYELINHIHSLVEIRTAELSKQRLEGALIGGSLGGAATGLVAALLSDVGFSTLMVVGLFFWTIIVPVLALLDAKYINTTQSSSINLKLTRQAFAASTFLGSLLGWAYIDLQSNYLRTIEELYQSFKDPLSTEAEVVLKILMEENLHSPFQVGP